MTVQQQQQQQKQIQTPTLTTNQSRIEIHGQSGGPCDRTSNVEVNRSFPSILLLEGYDVITPEEWENFCIELNTALKPIQRMKDMEFIIVVIGCVMIIALFVGGLVLYTSNSDDDDEETNTDSELNDDDDDYFWTFFVAIGCLVILVPLGLKVLNGIITHKVRHTIQSICDDYSKKYPFLSFRIQFESMVLGIGQFGNNKRPSSGYRTSNYIEVNIEQGRGGEDG